MSITEKSNHAIMDCDTDEEILNLKRKLSECLAEKDRAAREKNELLIEKRRLAQKLEELEEEVRVKAEAILAELEKEQEILNEAVKAQEEKNAQLRNDADEIRSKSEFRSILAQYERVEAEVDVLLDEKKKQIEVFRVKRRERTAGRQIERSTQCHKEIVRCDLISLIVDVTSHICETIFTSKHSKLKDM